MNVEDNKEYEWVALLIAFPIPLKHYSFELKATW
jgi:hypothetical protein